MSHLERNSEKIQSLYQFYLDVEREKFNEWAKIYLRHLEYFLYSIHVCSAIAYISVYFLKNYTRKYRKGKRETKLTGVLSLSFKGY